jgi:uncharacterized protein (TIGR02265 family)
VGVFVVPDWSAGVDFEQRIAAVPERATARGMFFQFLVPGLGPSTAGKVTSRRYLAFKNYPLREYVEVLALSCAEQASSLAPAEHLQRLGHQVYPNYAQTLTGMAIFAVARTFRQVVELAPAAYRVTISPGSVRVRSIEDGHAIVELRDLWVVPELHQVGIWQGAMSVCGARGEIRVEALDLGNVNFELTWREAADP